MAVLRQKFCHVGMTGKREPIEAVNKIGRRVYGERAIPLLGKEGWTRHQENAAKPPLMERTGWSITSHVATIDSGTWLVSDHPVCAASEATRLFLTSAATPPYKGGEYARSRLVV